MNAPVSTLLDDADLARADAYALLAHLFFAAPREEVLATLRQMGAAPAEADAANDVAADPVSQAWLALCREAATNATPALGAEYDALFISVGKPPVSLYASWHLTGFLMEKPLALLRDDLERLGLGRRAEQRDPEDHIAGELEVMRHLIMCGEAGAQKDFFERHLLSWYGALCAALETAEDAVFYRAVARFMRAFLDMERDYFRLQAADGGMQ